MGNLKNFQIPAQFQNLQDIQTQTHTPRFDMSASQLFHPLNTSPRQKQPPRRRRDLQRRLRGV